MTEQNQASRVENLSGKVKEMLESSSRCTHIIRVRLFWNVLHRVPLCYI